jgi:hypothetical protein
VSAAVQLRIDGANGYGLPLKPEALAELSEFELRHVLRVLDLDDQQMACAETAVAAVLRGDYGEATSR